MKIQEIKNAVDKGLNVCWKNSGYLVEKDKNGVYYISFISGNSCIGLTDLSGTILNGNEKDFFINTKEIF